MSEKQVRSHIKAAAVRLARRSNMLPVSMIEELEVSGGKARIDIAFMSEYLTGIEIKSSKDNLSRLAKQSSCYAPYFDFLVLVVDTRMVDEALEMLPEHWGIIATVSEIPSIKFRQLRKPLINPERRSYDLLRLLWKDELLILLGERDCDPNKVRDSKANLREQIILLFDPETIRNSCLSALAKRNNWRIQQLLSGII